MVLFVILCGVIQLKLTPLKIGSLTKWEDAHISMEPLKPKLS